MENKYIAITKIETPFPLKPHEPNYFNAPHPGDSFSFEDNTVYPYTEGGSTNDVQL